jgi:hypothetical protein
MAFIFFDIESFFSTFETSDAGRAIGLCSSLNRFCMEQYGSLGPSKAYLPSDAICSAKFKSAFIRAGMTLIDSGDEFPIGAIIAADIAEIAAQSKDSSSTSVLVFATARRELVLLAQKLSLSSTHDI